MRISRMLGLLYSKDTSFDEDSFTYTGTYTFSKDSDNNWLITLKTSGTLTMLKSSNVDIFLVGGGGAGGYIHNYSGSTNQYGAGAGGGGGGYTASYGGLTMTSSGTYACTIGTGGTCKCTAKNTTSSTNATASKIVIGATTYSANGGINGTSEGGHSSGTSATGGGGGNGGSGGGAGAKYNSSTYGAGGTAGSNGTSKTASGGQGQINKTGYGYPTYAFYQLDGDTSATAYSAGGNGGGGKSSASGSAGTANTGNGGNGASCKTYTTTYKSGGAGGTGVILIRNAR